MDAGGPAFSAYISTASQSLTSSVFSKVLCQAEEFDTAGAYDNATNYRFQPSVAGYYQLDGSVAFAGSATYATVAIYKNGGEAKRGSAVVHPTGSSMGANVSTLVYLNGSTDYVELWAYAQGTSLSMTGAAAPYTYFQGCLVRPA
jgi:hypothetical protein